MPATPTDPRRLLPWGFLAAATLIGLALLWGACESHYQACIDRVDVLTRGDDSAFARVVRNQELKQCNRAPF